MSPVVYAVKPVPPLVVAMVVALQVPVVTVPSVVILVCPTYVEAISTVGLPLTLFR